MALAPLRKNNNYFMAFIWKLENIIIYSALRNIHHNKFGWLIGIIFLNPQHNYNTPTKIATSHTILR